MLAEALCKGEITDPQYESDQKKLQKCFIIQFKACQKGQNTFSV